MPIDSRSLVAGDPGADFALVSYRKKPAAAREAYEEAGARGDMKRRVSGAYSYNKLLDDWGIIVLCEVKVFPLRVRRMEKVWPEQRQRVVRWFEPANAAEAVTEPGLKTLIGFFALKLSH